MTSDEGRQAPRTDSAAVLDLPQSTEEYDDLYEEENEETHNRRTALAVAAVKNMADRMEREEDRNDSPQDPPVAQTVNTSAPRDPQSGPFISFRTTTVSLASTSATSSAFPESFGLQVSACGRWVAAFNSSALYILSTAHLSQYQEHCRAFRLRRKPIAVSIIESGRLAILTTPHKIDVYQCESESAPLLAGKVSKIATIWLDIEARTVNLSDDGEVVAASGEGVMELKSLSKGGQNLDKRMINCGLVDYILFSSDSRSILLSAAARKTRTSTFISVNPAFEDAMFEDAELEPLGNMWISRLLFPDKVLARQAAMLPDRSAGHIDQILAFDAHADRFGIFNMDEKKFTKRMLGLPENFRFSRTERFSDCGPSISSDGSHVAVTLQLIPNLEIWIYHLTPDQVDQALEDQSGGEGSEQASRSRPVLRLALPPREEGMPAEVLSTIRWVRDRDSNTSSARLLALVNTTAVTMPEDMVPTDIPAASGKLILFDLGCEDVDNTTTPESITLDLDAIEVFDDLADEQLAIDQEIDLVRRRTTKLQRRPENAVLLTPSNSLREPRRSLSSGSYGRNSALVGLHDLADSTGSNGGRPRRRRSLSSLSSMSERESDTASPALVAADEPYVQSQPRSQFTLQRAATVAANSINARTHLRALPDQPLEFRRADGLREMPHESDADNWVPPPPPYTANPEDASDIPPVPALPVSVTGSALNSTSPLVVTSFRHASPTSNGLGIQAYPFPASPPHIASTAIHQPAQPIRAYSSTSGAAIVRSPGDQASVSTQSATSPFRQPFDTPSPPSAPHTPSRTYSAVSTYTRPDTSIPSPPRLRTSFSQSCSVPSSPATRHTNDIPVPLTAIPTSATHNFAMIDNMPTAEQLNSLHRRSTSGTSNTSIPRAARGAAQRTSAGSYLPAVRPNSVNYAAQPSPPGPSRVRPRPEANRLATIASVVSYQSHNGDAVNGQDQPAEESDLYRAASIRGDAVRGARSAQSRSSQVQNSSNASFATVGRRRSWWQRSKSTNDARASTLSLPAFLPTVGEDVSDQAPSNAQVPPPPTSNAGAQYNNTGTPKRQRTRLSRRITPDHERRASDPAVKSQNQSGKTKGKAHKAEKGGKCVVM